MTKKGVITHSFFALSNEYKGVMQKQQDSNNVAIDGYKKKYDLAMGYKIWAG